MGGAIAPTALRLKCFSSALRPDAVDTWKTLVRPGKRVRTGDTILFDESLRAEVIAQGDYGERTLRFHSTEPLQDAFERLGKVPLPPYIHREPDDARPAAISDGFRGEVGFGGGSDGRSTFHRGHVGSLPRSRARRSRESLFTWGWEHSPHFARTRSPKIELHEEYFEIEAADAARLAKAKRVFLRRHDQRSHG